MYCLLCLRTFQQVEGATLVEGRPTHRSLRSSKPPKPTTTCDTAGGSCEGVRKQKLKKRGKKKKKKKKEKKKKKITEKENTGAE